MGSGPNSQTLGICFSPCDDATHSGPEPEATPMPRRSSAEIMTLATFNPAGMSPPPEPPEHLSPQAAAVWLEIARSRPRQFSAFELRTLLAVYACHVVSLRLLSEQVAKLEASPDNLSPMLDKLLMMRARESQAVARLAARLRLLPTKTETPLPPSVPWAR